MFRIKSRTPEDYLSSNAMSHFFLETAPPPPPPQTLTFAHRFFTKRIRLGKTKVFMKVNAKIVTTYAYYVVIKELHKQFPQF